jgi:putative peptidoglycan lipid II flippase
MAQSAGEKIVKAAALLMALQFLGQLTGLLKQVLIAAQFGTSETMDGYLVATAVVGIILVWVALPINQTLIPMFRYDLAQRGEKTAWDNASTLFNNLALVLILIALVGELLAPAFVTLVAPGFDSETTGLATWLARITMASVFFVGMGGVLSQILFSYERFFLPGIVVTVDNLVVVAALLILSSNYGIYGLAVAGVLGTISHFVLQLPILWEKRRLYSRKVDLLHPGMVEMGKLSFPLLISAGGTELARITDRIFASLLPSGSLSALAFAQRLTSLQYDFLIRPLQRSTFPHFSRLTAEENFKALSRQLFHYLRIVFFLTLPIAVGVMVTAEFIVRVVYQRGAFDEASVHLTSQALLFYAIGFPAAAVSRILDRTFFSLKDTRTPTKIALLRIGVKIFLSWILIQHLAHVGIALAESISQVVRVPFLFLLLPDQVKGREGWRTIKSFGQTLSASILMGGAIYLIGESINGLFSVPLELVALALLGAAIYGLMAFLFQGEETQTLLNAVATLGARYLPSKS